MWITFKAWNSEYVFSHLTIHILKQIPFKLKWATPFTIISKNFFLVHFSINWANSKTFPLFTTEILSFQFFPSLASKQTSTHTHTYWVYVTEKLAGVVGDILWMSRAKRKFTLWISNFWFLVSGHTHICIKSQEH